MKKRFIRIVILILIISGVFYFNGGLEKLLKSPTVQAFGDLIVDFHTVGPIFNLTNMKPGDSETKPIDVTNDGSVSRFISVRGARTGGVGLDPKIETVLNVTIKDGSTALYGPKSMTDFFADSLSPDGIPLNVIDSGGHKTYNFLVEFPTSANNLYQAKSVVADISFGIITGNNVVINEVYYNAKLNHWLSWLIDRMDQDHWEEKHIKFEKKRLFRRQWIELYNPTDHDISLKNWSLTDNSGKKLTIHTNKKIRAGGYALLSKNPFIWWYWWLFFRGDRSATGVEFGRFIGNGLDIEGDRLILKSPTSEEVDRMSWGSDNSGFTPAGTNPAVPQGHSTERQAPGFDTNTASDWVDRNPPTPGN